GLPDRLAREGRAAGPVPRSLRRRPRRAGQPEADRRLPRGLRGAAGAVARRRRLACDPERELVPAAGGAEVKLAVALLALLAGGAAAPPARVQIGAAEYSFSLSRQTIRAGPAIVELVNFGEDPHD